METSLSSLEPELNEVFNGLKRQLHDSRDRAYYDEVVDSIAVQKYYTGLDFALHNPQRLYELLNNLLIETHSNILGYEPSKYLYTWVDLRPKSLMIQSIFSGTDVDPEALILADLRILAARNTRLVELGLPMQERNSFANDLRALDAIDEIENENPFNCEHVVPQAWFYKLSPMRGDLHHLFSCIIKCNEFRDTFPFYDFTSSGNQVKEECGSRDVTLGFEPKFGKGAVARATLYFILRYLNKLQPDMNFNKVAMLSTLLDWHNLEPPTEYEKHRNVPIYELQGNRNPLIDFPELSQKVNFLIGLYN